MSQVEQPTYTVERADGVFEVRAYPPMIVAQVDMRGDRRTAIGAGFRMIAGYIFGGNAPNQKIAMTAPVLQQPAPQAKGQPDQPTGAWTIRFVMPRRWSLETLPKPSDPRVTLLAQPAATFAVVRFSGLAGAATIATKTRALTAFIAAQGLHGEGAPILAFFNPPWTLPFLRRNEIMVAVKPT